MATFTKVNPGDPIQAHQLDQIIDALIGTASSGVAIALTALSDPTNYALTVQNDESGNSRALNVLKSDGTNLIRADASGVTLGSPLNLPTGSVTSAAIADQGVANVDLGPDVARANLLTNGGFEIWQRGNGPFAGNLYSADRWLCYQGSGSTFSITKITNGPPGASNGSALQAVYTHAVASLIAQDLKISEYSGLRNNVLSFSAWVYSSVGSAAQLSMSSDGTGAPTGTSVIVPAATWTRLTCTLSAAVPNDATNVRVGLSLGASCTALITRAMLVVGSVAANYAPLHPADDLARCLRYYEVVGPGNTGSLVISGITTGASQFLRVSVRHVRKAVVPTLTKVGTWNLGNASQPVANQADVDGFQLQTQSVAAGDTYAYNGAGGCWVTAESNP